MLIATHERGIAYGVCGDTPRGAVMIAAAESTNEGADMAKDVKVLREVINGMEAEDNGVFFGGRGFPGDTSNAASELAQLFWGQSGEEKLRNNKQCGTICETGYDAGEA